MSTRYGAVERHASPHASLLLYSYMDHLMSFMTCRGKHMMCCPRLQNEVYFSVRRDHALRSLSLTSSAGCSGTRRG